MRPPPAIRTILGAEVRGLWNRLVKRGATRLVVLGALLAVAIVVIGGAVFSLGDAAAQFLPMARDAMLAGGFTALSVLMLVVGFPSVIATFFVGRDLLQLVLAPVRPVEIFFARAVLAMTANLLISGILIAGAFGVGVGSGASTVYYALALLLVFVIVMVVTSFQVMVMSLIIRWVPARIARDVAAGVAALVGVGFYLTWNVSLRRTFGASRVPDFSNLAAFAQRTDWLPSAWPGHALSAVIESDWSSAIVWTLFCLAFGLLLVATAGILYQRTLLAGLGLFGGGQAVWKRTPARRPERMASGAGSPGRAIARKDWLGYRRDIRRLSRLLPALLFPVGYALTLIRPSRTLNGLWSDVAVAAFISMFVSMALAVPSIPSERRGFQLLRMSPLGMSQIIRVKIALTLPPVLALTMLLTIVMAVAGGIGIAELVQLLLLVVWLVIGFVSVGVSAGAIDPNFEAADDRRAVGLLGTMTSTGGAIAFALLSIGAFGLFHLGAAAATGARLGPLPSTPAVAALIAGAGVLLAAAAGALVVVLLVVADSRLRAYEGAISST
jgi:hypothetical protein